MKNQLNISKNFKRPILRRLINAGFTMKHLIEQTLNGKLVAQYVVTSTVDPARWSWQNRKIPC